MLVLSRGRRSLHLPRCRRRSDMVRYPNESQAESSTAHFESPSAYSSSIPLRARLSLPIRHLSTSFVRPEISLRPEVGSNQDENAVRFAKRPKPRNKSANVTLLNARKLAQQIRQQTLDQPETLVEPDEPEDEIRHLRLLSLGRELRAFNQSESEQLTDMLKKEPQKPPRYEAWEPEYVKPYRRLYKSIENAFTSRQLRNLSRELGLKASYKDTKLELIHKILEMWGWAQPVVLSQAQEDQAATKEQGE